MTDSQALVSSSAALVDQENCPALANRISTAFLLLIDILFLAELQNHGVNVADIKKLQTAGICTGKKSLFSIFFKSKQCKWPQKKIFVLFGKSFIHFNWFLRGISDARYQAMITAANKISDKGKYYRKLLLFSCGKI